MQTSISSRELTRILWSNTFATFFIIWCTLGIFINKNDQEAYNLQHAGVEAVAKYYTFQFGKSQVSNFKNVGDVFHYQGKTLAAKQPGQFLIGAVPYKFLFFFGFNYEKNYKITSALVTWLSASLLCTLCLLAFFHLLFKVWGYSAYSSILATFSLMFGTIFLPYSGVLHHDIMATSTLFLSFYWIERAVLRVNQEFNYALIAGLLAGITIFISMLGALAIVAVLIYGLIRLAGRDKAIFLLGIFIGLLPLGVYNFYYFGNPITPANLAGNYTDTFFEFRSEIFWRHIQDYLTFGVISINKYSPVTVLGFFGLLFLPKLRKQAVLIYGLVFIHLLYILNIETIGHCQYGPRYLMPLVPFCTIGIVAFISNSHLGLCLNRLITYSFVMVVICSIGIHILGALQGTMYCDIGSFAPLKYWSNLNLQTLKDLPLAAFLIFVLTVYVSMGGYFAYRNWLLSESCFYRLINKLYSKNLISKDGINIAKKDLD